MTADFSSLVQSIASTYATDTIYILGKGPSADLVPTEAFSRSLVIALNDAERIAPADITIFHDEWVEAALATTGRRSRLYLTSTGYAPEQGEVVRVPYIPLTQASSELMMQRLLGPGFAIEEVLFISALKVANMVARVRNRRQTVYMVGFDFHPQIGYAQAVSENFSPDTVDERENKISLQEYYLLNALYVLSKSELDVIHVGTKPFSRLSPEELASRVRPMPVLPGAINIPACSAIVTAELTTNHFGDRQRLERMIRAAAAAGAGRIKLQKRNVQTFYTAEQLRSAYTSPFGKTFADYRHALELSGEDFEFVDRLCQALEIEWFTSILDQPSFEYMLQFDPKLVKLPSTISEHRSYLSYVAENYSGSVVLSTGMTDRSYEEWVLNKFNRCEKLYLLQCNSAYPTPAQDCNIAVVRHYNNLSQKDPRIVAGYSSHDFGWLASALAAAAGAKMIEKHVKLGNTDWAHFDAVAIDLTTGDFAEYCQKIREADLILGDETKGISPSEHHKYSVPLGSA